MPNIKPAMVGTTSGQEYSHSLRNSSSSSNDSCYIEPGGEGVKQYKIPGCGQTPPSVCKCRSSTPTKQQLVTVTKRRSPSPCLMSESYALRRLSAAPGGGAAAAVLSISSDLPSIKPPSTPKFSSPKFSSPNKPCLRKGDAIDLSEIEARKKMERGISHATANESLVSAARTVVQHDFHHITSEADGSIKHHNSQQNGSGDPEQPNSPNIGHGCVIETPLYTFTLPDLTAYQEDFRGFLEKDLIEMSALISLEQTGRLNWWADTGTCQRLWPLATTGDGNCLLHAASLGMWGFHDRLLTLRKALYSFLTSSPKVDFIYRRWRWQAAQQNYQSGLSLTESEWSEEWNSVLRLASTEPRPQPTNQPPKRRSRLSTVSDDEVDNPLYESLEEVHVLVLAHILRRPIIVVSDTVLKDAYGEALAPIPFGGIYLPLEVSPSECDNCPLILTYDAGHFSSLVTMQSQSNLPCVIPVTDSNHALLPIQFSVDPGFQIDWGQDENNPVILSQLDLRDSDKLGLLKEYLDIVQVPLPACFLDSYPDLDLTSPESLDSTSMKDVDVCSQHSQEHQPSSKSRTAKQIQSVAKQFGSIGKTVSKKIKKNIGNITRLARTGSFKGDRSHPVSQTTRPPNCRIVGGHQDHILAAMIHTQKCLPYLQEMNNNYLQEAKLRFDKDKELKSLQAAERQKKEGDRVVSPTLSIRSQCVSPDCHLEGDERTSYLCHHCYHRQIQQAGETRNGLTGSYEGPLYGSGRSRFYVNTDDNSHESLAAIPSCKHPTLKNYDKSLYLAKSTFYRDGIPGLIVPISVETPDPMPIVPVESPPQPPSRRGRKKGIADLVQSEFKAHLQNGRDIVYSAEKQGASCSGRIFSPSHNSAVDGEKKNVSSNVMKVELPGLFEAKACQTIGCSFFGSSQTNSFCSKCFLEYKQPIHQSKV